MPESQPGIDVAGEDTQSQDRVRQLHEQLLQGDVLEVLGYERGKISELLQKDKRSEVFQRLIQRREEIFPDIEEKQLQDDLNTLNKYLDELDYMQRVLVDYRRNNQSPEKAGMLRRAFERVKGFAKDHPVVVTLLAGALMAAGASYMGWLPKFNALGFGLGEGGSAAEGAAVEIASGETASVAATGIAEVVATAVGPTDVLVTGEGYVFRGVHYGFEQMEVLRTALEGADISSAEMVKIFRSPEARVSRWGDLRSLLSEIGVSHDSVMMPREILEK